ncbi:transcriptional regulator, MerR family [Methylocella silvestris BL2]|uniref:Transcriptional regulator, MerR family n=1 Tax=Methylocella silvestris (strain DSM 15510 / CIP 108128 / LMG 27833 / NCIMB 13906 / BL2) TaxID=395965 RepID=B8ENA9_METSB|nr:MerR family transcriptional regulator [Methylocella silvestris]ACK49622.1 transcriptional regulator, MerR family [Methylocella silvestris BL2]
MDKSADAFRTISEVAEELDLPQHVLRFWETRFPQIRPLKRAGGRRFYRPNDIEILRAIRRLLYSEGYTIKGVQRILKEQGARSVIAASETAASGGGPQEQAAANWSGDLFQGTQTSSQDDAEQSSEAERSGANPHLYPPAAAPLRSQTIDRLRAIMRDLEECERMLDAARRT